MYKVKILIPFWDDGKTLDRQRNVSFSWEQTKKLNDFLNQNGIKSYCRLYDFSKNRYHEDAIHIPFESYSYERSKKINIILDDNSDCEYVFFMDGDVFFHESDFEKLLNLIQNITTNTIYTFDAAKLTEEDTCLFIENPQINIFDFNWSFAYSGDKTKGPLYQHIGGLGGAFIIQRNLLNTYGRFNEEIKTWGGEDGDSLSRILNSPNEINLKSVRDFYPFHLFHFTDWGNKKYFNN